MSEALKVEATVDEETGTYFVKTIGTTLSEEGFATLVKAMSQNIPEMSSTIREITLLNGTKKKCANCIVYQNTGMRHFNFTDDVNAYEEFGVILELKENGEPFLYVDPKLTKERFDKGHFNEFFKEEVGLQEDEDEENLRRIETYIRLMDKGSDVPEKHIEIQMYNLINLGALALYFGNMIIQNTPDTEWSFREVDEMGLIVETIEKSKFHIDSLQLLKHVYTGKGIRLLDFWEKIISLTGTKLTPLLAKVMEEHHLTQEQAVSFLQDALSSYIGEVDNRVSDYSVKKAERNDPCPCGSGKKFKKCCMNNSVVKEPVKVQFEETKGLGEGNTVTVAFFEKEGLVHVLGKHYSNSGLCWWEPTTVRHTIEDVEEWKKLVKADARLHFQLS